LSNLVDYSAEKGPERMCKNFPSNIIFISIILYVKTHIKELLHYHGMFKQ
jgi:hypothetical protein